MLQYALIAHDETELGIYGRFRCCVQHSEPHPLMFSSHSFLSRQVPRTRALSTDVLHCAVMSESSVRSYIVSAPHSSRRKRASEPVLRRRVEHENHAPRGSLLVALAIPHHAWRGCTVASAHASSTVSFLMSSSTVVKAV